MVSCFPLIKSVEDHRSPNRLKKILPYISPLKVEVSFIMISFTYH